MPAPELLLCTDLADAATRAAEHITRARQATPGKLKLCVDGGSPTKALLALLADGPFALDPKHTVVFLGDERRVPVSDARSNRALVEKLLVTPLQDRTKEEVHFHAPDGANPDGNAAALDFEALWRAQVGEDGADLHLLGMGPDGHTASIFPGSRTMDEAARWVLAVDAPTTVDPKVARLTLTPPAILRAKRLILFAVGAEKRDALKRLLAASGSEHETPARLLHRYPGTAVIFADRAAMG